MDKASRRHYPNEDEKIPDKKRGDPGGGKSRSPKRAYHEQPRWRSKPMKEL